MISISSHHRNEGHNPCLTGRCEGRMFESSEVPSQVDRRCRLSRRRRGCPPRFVVGHVPGGDPRRPLRRRQMDRHRSSDRPVCPGIASKTDRVAWSFCFGAEDPSSRFHVPAELSRGYPPHLALQHTDGRAASFKSPYRNCLGPGLLAFPPTLAPRGSPDTALTTREDLMAYLLRDLPDRCSAV